MTEIELAIPPRIDRRRGIDQRLGATRIVGVVRCTAGEREQPDRYGPSVLELRGDRSRREATIRDLRDDEVPLDLLTIRTLNVSALMAVLDRDRLRAARRRCRRWSRGRCLRRLRHGFTRSERERQARDQEREAHKGRNPGYRASWLPIPVRLSSHRCPPLAGVHRHAVSLAACLLSLPRKHAPGRDNPAGCATGSTLPTGAQRSGSASSPPGSRSVRSSGGSFLPRSSYS